MTSFDISDTLTPNSDQLDACDLLGGPRTFLIERVTKGNAEQPVQIHLTEFPRPWRPGKSMRRVLVACWGPDAASYVGRRVTLYCDNDVVFGGQAVGGTRISALSHIDKPKKVPLLISRGKSAIFVVQPLNDEPAKVVGNRRRPNAAALIENAQEARHNADLDDVARAAAGLTGDELDAVKAAVVARRAELKERPETAPEPPNGTGSDVDPGDDGWPDVPQIPGTDAE